MPNSTLETYLFKDTQKIEKVLKINQRHMVGVLREKKQRLLFKQLVNNGAVGCIAAAALAGHGLKRLFHLGEIVHFFND